MIERRNAVIAADKAGDDALVEKRLYDLQRYVSSHMNTDPGRVPLDGKYQRDNDALKAKLEQQSDSNPQGNVYKKAADVCDPIGRAQGWRWPDTRYTDCINKELEKYPSAGVLIEDYQPLSTDAYYHTYISPKWSPDFAGWSLVVCAVILSVIVLRIFALLLLKIILKFKYRRL